MAFRFPLQSVLRLYRSLEHQQELRLRTANQQVARVRHLIEQLDARKTREQAQQSGHISEGTTSAEIRFALLCDSSLAQGRRQLEEELKKMIEVRDRQQAAFYEARRRRETLDSLHERQLHHYQIEASRRAQRQADDMFLQRRKRSDGPCLPNSWEGLTQADPEHKG